MITIIVVCFVTICLLVTQALIKNPIEDQFPYIGGDQYKLYHYGIPRLLETKKPSRQKGAFSMHTNKDLELDTNGPWQRVAKRCGATKA